MQVLADAQSGLATSATAQATVEVWIASLWLALLLMIAW